MGIKKWVLLLIVLMFPATAGGSFVPINDAATMQHYYPDKIAFPVLPKTLYKIPDKQFKIVGQTLCIAERTSNQVDFLDTVTGKATSKPDGFEYLPQSYKFYSPNSELTIFGDPPTMIASQFSLVIDREYYLKLTSDESSKNGYKDIAVLYDNDKELLRFRTITGISNAKKLGPDLIVAYGYSTIYVIDLKNHEVNDYQYSRDQILDWSGTVRILVKDDFMLAGCSVINMKEKKVTSPWIASNAVFYGENLLYATSPYIDDTSVIFVSDVNGKLVGKWETKYINLHFIGAGENFAYGWTTDKDKNNSYFELIAMPDLHELTKVPLHGGTIIGDDGQNIIYYSDDKIHCIDGATGVEKWVNSGFAGINNEIQYTQLVGGKLFSFEADKNDHAKPNVTVRQIDGTDNKILINGIPTAKYGYIYYNTTNLIAFEDGFIVVPIFDEHGTTKVLDFNGKLVREIAIDELANGQLLYHLYAFGKLFVNCGGYSLYEIDLNDGTYTKTTLVDKIQKDAIFYNFLLMDNEHIVAQTCKGTAKVFERKGMKLIWEFESKYIYGLNKNLVLSPDKVFVIDQKKTIDITKYNNHGYYYCWGDNAIIGYYRKSSRDSTHLIMVGQHGQIFEQIYKNMTFQPLSAYALSNNLVNHFGVCDITNGSYIQDFRTYFGYILSLVPIDKNFIITGKVKVDLFDPCPTYSLKRIGDDQVEITNTRNDGKASDFEGTIAVVAIDSDSPFPDLLKIDQRIPIEKLAGGKKTTIKLDFSKYKTLDGSLPKLGLFVESNGLLDNAKTFPKKENRVLYDGIFGMNQNSTFMLIKWDELK